uniref:Reverse transcriptase zinc-binding domain-containing protein n=1 Tax=Fagus sylvatica TaxID=28930 RepID=A0A2N9HPM1_FAGSY
MDETPKFHLVNWSQICTPLRAGGLAIWNLRRFNKALLGKWLWRYGLKREALWRLVVDAKYGSLWGGWCSKSGTGSYGDWWCGDRALNAAFPELFTISQDKEASVADLMSFPNGRLHWDFHFVRNSIWKVKVPPRIAFLSWTAALGNLLTIDNLRKRNLIIIDWSVLEILGIWSFGGWSRIVSCGVSGGRGMLAILRIVKDL